MRNWPEFEFSVYPYVDDGSRPAAEPLREISKHRTESAARSRAGTLAKKYRGPVDLARYGSEPWGERYISTANPSPHHAAGYRFERIES